MPTSNPLMLPKLFRIEEVSRLLDCTPKTVRNWIRRGHLKASKPGRSYLVDERELRAFIKRNLFRP
jgi:excisionase family DNA binding protein